MIDLQLVLWVIVFCLTLVDFVICAWMLMLLREQ